ncbi:MAG: UDP-N-acetylglucosamine 2-epimerase (hydrolyzing), partial [Bacteroidetes bacterium HGW-Bacteroidetes-22]
DLMYSVYKKLDEAAEIQFKILITGPHLSEKYGYTARFVEDDGFEIADKLFNLLDTDSKLGRVSSIGAQIPLLAHSLIREKPDLVIVAGDREEAISVTLTCAYLGIACAHFFGGDIAKDGNVDNAVRYASGKLASLHFVTLEEHRQTLLKLGEDDWRIFVIGNPALDRILSIQTVSKGAVLNEMGVQDSSAEPYFVLIQHSIITETELQDRHIRQTLDAVISSGHRCFINYPNSDAGNQAIINAYLEYEQKYPSIFRTFKNLNRNLFVNLMRNASGLLGNSSAGILEAPSFGLPVVNIGQRQRGRTHSTNVIFVDNSKDQIEAAISKILNDEVFIANCRNCINPYGNGHSSERVLEIVKSLTINKNLIFKNITY